MAVSLTAVIAGVLGIDQAALSDDSGMNVTEGWDSLKQFQVMTEVEQVFGTKFSFEQLEHGLSIGGIRAVLAAKGIPVAE